MKKAIIVVSFGTTHSETRQKTIEACENAIRRCYPGYQLHRAFTSNMVIQKIKREEGIQVPTVEEVLVKLKGSGVQTVLIQPLHIIFGGEYEKIVKQARPFAEYFDCLKIGKPLLNNMDDYEKVRDILISKYQPQISSAATVLMGHGSQHYAFTAYAAMDHLLQESAVYIGCVESYPPIDQIEKLLRKKGVKKIQLAPFMLVAGDHATNDMASEDRDSWYSFFKTRGYEVDAQLVGLGELPEIQEIYIQHVADMMEE